MTNPEQSPATAGDPLLARAIADWRAIAHGGSTEAFRQDLTELWKRDSASGQPWDRSQNDMQALNKQLASEGLLPNMEIFGVRDGHIVVQERSGQFAIVEEHGGMTQVKDVNLNLPLGPLQVIPDKPAAAGAAPSEVSPSGVHQGDSVGDCRFEARLAALAQADPEAVKRMVARNDNGTYTVTFPGDKEHPVTVDAPTPWERSTFSDGGSEWALIIEKAYRQRMHLPFGPGNGSAKEVEGLLTGHSSADLVTTACDPLSTAVSWVARQLGARATCGESLTHQSVAQLVDAYNKGFTTLDKGDGGRALQEALSNHMIVVASFSDAALAVSQSERTANDTSGHRVNLEEKHAYTVIGYDPVNQTVTLRNPWGKNLDAQTGQEVGDGQVVLSLAQFMRLCSVLEVERTDRSR